MEDNTVKIAFSNDESGFYKRDFLRETFPYFKMLFESGMKDASSSSYNLSDVMSKSVFDLFHDGKKLIDGYTLLHRLQDMDDGSDEFPALILNAMNYLQIYEHLTSKKDKHGYPASLIDARDLAYSDIHHPGGAEFFEVKYVKTFIYLRFFYDSILSLNDDQGEKDIELWHRKTIPDVLPNVPEKYTWMKYFPDCEIFVFIDEKFADPEGDQDPLPDKDVHFCFALKTETETNTTEYQIQEYDMTKLRTNDKQVMLYPALYHCPIDIKKKGPKRFKVSVDISIAPDTEEELTKWLEEEIHKELEASFEILFP